MVSNFLKWPERCNFHNFNIIIQPSRRQIFLSISLSWVEVPYHCDDIVMNMIQLLHVFVIGIFRIHNCRWFRKLCSTFVFSIVCVFVFQIISVRRKHFLKVLNCLDEKWELFYNQKYHNHLHVDLSLSLFIGCSWHFFGIISNLMRHRVLFFCGHKWFLFESQINKYCMFYQV